MSGNADMIITLDRARMAAMAEQNIAFLQKHLCKGLVYTHSSARVDSKASLIGNMENGSTVYTEVVPSEVVAQDMGDVVVLTGLARISVTVSGALQSFRVRFTDVYQNQAGTWRMVAWQSTKLPA